MPWTCPACRTPIRYNDYERFLNRAPFQCPACHCELKIDKITDNLIVAPLPVNVQDRGSAKRSR